MPSKSSIQSMFNQLADRYDFMNNLLSLGTHWHWKNKLIKEVLKLRPIKVLDGATGTGDIAYLLKSLNKDLNTKVVGIDISEEMLKVARLRVPEGEFFEDDLTDLSFSDNAFDVSTVSFGIRNVENIDKALNELSRVSSKAVVILEFGSPQNQLLSKIYFFFMKKYMAILGRVVSRGSSYDYLVNSSEKFVCANDFQQLCQTIPNVKRVEYQTLYGGIVYLYTLHLT
ncbi:MAG: ubiquinone/menaquinone biosynthesis methyltransferase [Bacteriovoracaceae bacterium]